ncbi:MAG: N-formylglutamate deformylase [Planctomycetota bacterium]
MNPPTEVFDVRRPTAVTAPLLVSVPHTGVEVPPTIAARFANDAIAALPDTDWHLHRLYSFVPDLGATLCCARFSRYVVDLNRPADGHALYPGRAETGLVPRTTFGGEPIYRPGMEPDEAEVRTRVSTYWEPYHRFLDEELARMRDRFGYALLFEAHSITSHVPRFADGELPGFMLGDVDGTSCAAPLSAAVAEVLERSGISTSRNRPFKGGYITRAFGRPADRIHAMQLEMSQRLYMREGPPYAWDEERARRLAVILRTALHSLLHTLPR